MRPSNIPGSPDKTYQNKGWLGWDDFLGNNFLPFEEAREFVRSLKLNNQIEWREWSKSGMRPSNIPSNPDKTYKNKGWLRWGDFLGNEFLPFEEAREFVRSLNLKNNREWSKWSKSGMRPSNIPGDPNTVYKNKGWKSWADFLGTIGNGNRWTKPARLGFLEDFKDCLHTCSMAQLLTIIEACGLSKHIPFEMLYEIQETESNSPERIQLVSNIISEVVYGDSDESVNGLSEEASLVEAQLSEGASIVSILDNIYDSQLSQINQIKYLTSLENESITAALDEDKIQFLVTESINTLWYSVMNNQLDVEEIKSLPLKGKVPTRIIQTFYKEYKSVINLKLPKGWTYPHKPLLMQKLVTYRISQRKRYGNWSSVGSGKTIGAILAGRYVGAKNTLVITFNSTIGNEDERGWMKEIRDSFKDSNIYTKADKNIDLSNGGYNYLILNYETFQQATSADFVIDLLKRNTFDYIVLDEVQSIKNRGGSVSKRRDLIMGLINKVKENNPDYYLLAMSATPVINNSMEAKSLIQLIEMNEMEDISTTENIVSWLQLYRKMTHYGIRYKDHNDNILKGNQYTIIDVEADELYPLAASIRNEDILLQDQLVLDAKLHAVLPYINTSIGKTIIYTHFVKDIDERIYEYLTERGFKAGLYTGSESKLNRESALNEFIDGDIDVLIASSPLATGVDGLQKISDREIIISLPWTHAEFIQFVGRISRKGSIFSETGVDVIIPLVSINGIGHSFRWDYRKYNLITYKETIANAVVDGIIPKKITKTKEEIISYADDSISEWIERIKEKDDVKLKTP
jgi:superfamily II DNA or RNA helicase